MLETAELFWISTVRRDGRPHITPLPAVWHDSRLHFCTGPGERKAVNLADDSRVARTAGTHRWRHGLDAVVEGDAVRMADEPSPRVAPRQTVAMGVTGEPTMPGRRSGGAVRRKRLRSCSRSQVASSSRYQSSPRGTPSSNRQRWWIGRNE